MNPSILLKNGTVLLHGDGDVPYPRRTDILIEGNIISQMGTNLAAPSADTKVIDCRDKIVAPGFIDTHNHLWQTQLKGRHANDLLLDYLPKGNMQGYFYTGHDIFWGQLGGALEAIDAGTTCVVDHAHMNYSPETGTNAVSATVSSGIRAFFCYCPTSRVKSWCPLTKDDDLLPPWLLTQLESLAKQSPFGDGRVHIGLAFDWFLMPKQAVVDLFEKARRWGVKLITAHYTKGPYSGDFSPIQILESYGLLASDLIFSHSNAADMRDADLLKRRNAFVSCTPETEMQMALGEPLAFRPEFASQCALGVDCHSNNSSDMMTQMRLALQYARARANQAFLDHGKLPRRLQALVEDAFNLATIQGARAVHMEDKIGTIAPGKLADLVLFATDSPAMICAAQHNPLAAVVMHASVRDVDTVIVDGQIRKENGRLLPCELDPGLVSGSRSGSEQVTWTWADIAAQLLKSQGRVQRENEKVDMTNMLDRVIEAHKVDPNSVVDSIV
ncbi:hypothetical protein A1O3_02519 [Capronia epimyces CBS 606.96]|uniref:Amidohydrolase-related domain-containing protein n=1 Tax=Capronia epimyces CBS 606.96 TaxID=1182542 RepID=W9Y9E1_9EURO|nr:uncharacterized protein A1O3_02519 [Capronia epimyces CBS 606.96]EXJ89452.1 hypothetical protein A1O3_02519 [Capronia epimyces CBS 606.96]